MKKQCIEQLQQQLWLANGAFNPNPPAAYLKQLKETINRQGYTAWELLRELPREDHLHMPSGVQLAKAAYLLEMPPEQYHRIWSEVSYNDCFGLSDDLQMLQFHMETDRLHGKPKSFSEYVAQFEHYASGEPYIHELYYYVREYYPEMPELELQRQLLELVEIEDDLEFESLARIPWMQEHHERICDLVNTHQRNRKIASSAILPLLKKNYITMQAAWSTIKQAPIQTILAIQGEFNQEFFEQYAIDPFVADDIIEHIKQNNNALYECLQQPLTPERHTFWRDIWTKAIPMLYMTPEHRLWTIVSTSINDTRKKDLPTLTRENINNFPDSQRAVFGEALGLYLQKELTPATIEARKNNHQKTIKIVKLLEIVSLSSNYWKLVSGFSTDVQDLLLNEQRCIFVFGAVEYNRTIPPVSEWDNAMGNLYLHMLATNIQTFLQNPDNAQMFQVLLHAIENVDVNDTSIPLKTPFETNLFEQYCEYAQLDRGSIEQQFSALQALEVLSIEHIHAVLQPKSQHEALELNEQICAQM